MAITQQQREERRKFIGASDFPMICKLAPKAWGDPLKIYLDKLGVLPDFSSHAMTLGTLLEDDICTLYEQETGHRLIDPGITYRHPTIHYLGCNLDRVREADGRPVEIKMVGGEYAGEWGIPGTDEVPGYVACQVQSQMLVTGKKAVDVAALLLNLRRIQIYTVYHSEVFCDLLLKIAADFWGRVERQEPPEPDWSYPGTAELVSLLHKPDPRVTVELPPLAVLLADEDARLALALDAGQKRRDEVRGQLTQMLGAAGVGLLDDGRQVKRTQHTRQGKVITQLRVSSPRKRA